jgi:hypothetical protein
VPKYLVVSDLQSSKESLPTSSCLFHSFTLIAAMYIKVYFSLLLQLAVKQYQSVPRAEISENIYRPLINTYIPYTSRGACLKSLSAVFNIKCYLTMWYKELTYAVDSSSWACMSCAALRNTHIIWYRKHLKLHPCRYGASGSPAV